MFFPQRDPDRLAPAVAHVKVVIMMMMIVMMMMAMMVLMMMMMMMALRMMIRRRTYDHFEIWRLFVRNWQY